MKRKNRSKAMILAAKRRATPGDSNGAGSIDSGADSTKKITFGDVDEEEEEEDGDGDKSARPLPPPQQEQQQQQQQQQQQPEPANPRNLSLRSMTLFEDYYRRQAILPPEEWDSFLQHLRRPLPVTFRLCQMASHRSGLIPH